ncbi:GntR family transcriptional regulator [Kyrpidia spormannii]|uniref:DNA-binding transcriptional regulator, GntR family n=2 Tax=Kyrpidia spormannii TaxID=2055160 RepID=A0ACA8Z504_9BACL|nr:GntR family transcriptional regulator [Kyrpidia spormannii]CAB3389445.1 DNA-binding transcriptional regulator, GntR family [Kyrpidia spormannii]CAB3390174.1 DNA-binding transcriptional regulator, GntR family [Kyrpidia spormannii]
MVDDPKKLIDEDFSPIELRVYQILREQILSGELKAGERLIERELADKLRISRTPIREALRKLDSEGLIRIVPRKGGVVSDLKDEDIINMFEILESLEALAVRQAAERLQPEDREILKNVDESDVTKVIKAICKVARNRRLEDMLVGLLDLIRASARIGREQPGREIQANSEHRAILDAVVRGDGDQAVQLVREHIRRSIEAYQAQRRTR